MSESLSSDRAREMRGARHREWRVRAMKCPHCEGALRTRWSKRVARTTRQGVYECTTADCGWRGTFTLSIDATETPSAAPDPDVWLPLTRDAERRVRRALEAQQAHTRSATKSR